MEIVVVHTHLVAAISQIVMEQATERAIGRYEGAGKTHDQIVRRDRVENSSVVRPVEIECTGGFATIVDPGQKSKFLAVVFRVQGIFGIHVPVLTLAN